MLYALKRLALGVALIALASAILLYTDLEQRRGSASASAPVLRVAVLQHTHSVVLDDGMRGTLDALAERGYRDGERLKIDHFNAQGEMPTGLAIARHLVELHGGSMSASNRPIGGAQLTVVLPAKSVVITAP